jgi:excisionase family DNA binding protein
VIRLDAEGRTSNGGSGKAGRGRAGAARRPGAGLQGRRPRGADGRQSVSQAQDQLLETGALARRLNVTERFVPRLVAERRIPFLKVGRSVRFDPADVEAWLERAKVPVTAWRHAGGP